MSQNRDCLFARFYASRPPGIDLPAARQKIETCHRVLGAIEQARNYLEETRVVTVLTKEDCGSSVVVCLNLAGEEMLPAQPIDVTYEMLWEAIQALAPDAYIQFVTMDGKKLDACSPHKELVKDML